MHKNDLEQGYELIADKGRELIVVDSEGIEIARAKQVIIPPEGTLNNWVEVNEIIPEVVDKIEVDNTARIMELKRELAILKGESS